MDNNRTLVRLSNICQQKLRIIKALTTTKSYDGVIAWLIDYYFESKGIKLKQGEDGWSIDN